MSAARTGRARAAGPLGMRLSDLFWLAAFNILLFEAPIQVATGFTLVDELATLCLVAAAARRLVCGRGGRPSPGPWARASLLLTLVLVAWGLLGNATQGVQSQVFPIAVDLFACVKFPVALLSSYVALSGSDGALLGAVEAEAKVLAAALLVLGAANLFADFGMGTDPRYGLRASFKAVYGHPTYLVFACVGLSVVLLADRKRNARWIVMLLAVAVLSLRTKGIAWAALTAVLMATFGRRERLTALHAAACAGLALLIGYDQYESYFQHDGYARTELVRASLEVAADHPVLGPGFATFGSAVTAEPAYYSVLYYRYGLSSVWGLAYGSTGFLSDTFWPIVLGQFSWVGLLLYAGMLACLFMFAYGARAGTRLATVCCFAYLLISSTSESAFFNPASVYLAFCLGLALVGAARPGPRGGRGAPDRSQRVSWRSIKVFKSGRDEIGEVGVG